MTGHEAEVLKILWRFQYVTRVSLPRFLNLFASCPWCPTIKRTRTPGIDIVPRASEVIAEGLLKRLAERGLARVEGKSHKAKYFAVEELSCVDGIQPTL